VVVVVPAGQSRVPMMETVELDSKRKSRLDRLGEAARGKLSSSKTTCQETIKQFVERSRQR
jgi:predicted transcriptional regulator